MRQFRYYLVTLDRPDVAVRFRKAVHQTLVMLRERPFVGPRYQTEDQRFRELRSWPVQRFEAIRIYYLLDKETLHVVRILHGNRDVRRILGDSEIL